MNPQTTQFDWSLAAMMVVLAVSAITLVMLTI